MELLFREFGGAFLAILGSIAVITVVWATMYGGDAALTVGGEQQTGTEVICDFLDSIT